MSVDDCGACRALCCVAHAFDGGDDFAFDKAAGVPCIHLRGHACGIHGERVDGGFAGCVGYSCFGAGPVASAFDVDDDDRVVVFLALRAVRELQGLVDAALARWPSLALAAERDALVVVANDVDALVVLDVDGLRRRVSAALQTLAPRALALRVLSG